MYPFYPGIEAKNWLIWPHKAIKTFSELKKDLIKWRKNTEREKIYSYTSNRWLISRIYLKCTKHYQNKKNKICSRSIWKLDFDSLRRTLFKKKFQKCLSFLGSKEMNIKTFWNFIFPYLQYKDKDKQTNK